MKKGLFLIFIFTLILTSSLSAGEARLLRFPDVNGDKVAFVYAGDIYIAPRAGGQAIRLTSHEGLEMFPKFSPDGKQLAFTGQYDGDYAVYVIPVEGGEPKRLTFHPGIQSTSDRFGPENVVMGWHPDGRKVLFRSRKETNDWWDGRAYLVDVNGGLPRPLPMKVAGFTSFSPDAASVAYCPIHRDFRMWKRYKGGMAQDVWTFDLNTYESKKITDWEGTDNMPMWFQDKIYFNSDRTGTLNLYAYDMNSGETRAVTTFTEYDVRWPSLGPDGIAFENGGYLYVLDLPSETLKKVSISITHDRPLIRTEYVNVSDKVDDYDLSPDSKRAVFCARGDLFTVPAKEGNTRNLTNTSGANERRPTWSPDGRWVAYISDASGEEELYLATPDGKAHTRLTFDGYCHRYNPVWSPDSKKLVYADKELNLFYVDIEEKRPVKIDHNQHDMIRGYSWSPDSRYLAYHKELENRITAIFIYSFEDKKIRQVTPGYTDDYSPVFDPDGKYLYFMSKRDFNPILSDYEFQFVNQNIDNLFLIILAADGRSPFAPGSDEVEPDVDKKAENDKNKKDEKEVPLKVKIDFDGIYDRQVAFDLPAGNYRGLAAVPGAVFYTSNPMYGLSGKVTHDETVLNKFDIKEKKNYKFVEGLGGYSLAAKNDKMLLGKDSAFYIVPTSGQKADLSEGKVDISRMEMKLEPGTEFVQMFDEVWRMERDFFYDENMHGVDWKAMYDRYKVLVPYVSHRSDLTYILGEMVGELCCSHTYVNGPHKTDPASEKVGLFGVDFKINPDNNMIQIARILDGEYWDKELRSPFKEPGVDIREGEYLLAINDLDVNGEINPYSLTRNCVDKTITVTVNDRPDKTGAREVTVKPIASEEKLRYYNWVEDRRRYVDSVSGGTIGYIHIPDMDSFGLVRFTKMFYHQMRKPGIIFDVRYNGGGFVSGLILERLKRVVVAMGKSRNTVVRPAPGSGINAHMITLMNQFSCSDGDYFPYFFREYKLGPLMGKRTWGGVIGIEGYRPLLDGGYYTVPQGGILNLEGEWVMENVGVVPDLEIDNPPDRMARGFDDQLMKAVEYILKKLEEDPKVLPEIKGPPTPR